MSGHVDDLADEIQTRHASRRHRLLRKFTRVDTAKCDFRLVISQRTRRPYGPIVQQLREFGNALVAKLLQRQCGIVRRAPLLREAFRQALRQE